MISAHWLAPFSSSFETSSRMRHLRTTSVVAPLHNEKDAPRQRHHIDIDSNDRVTPADAQKRTQNGCEKVLETRFVRRLCGPEEHVEREVGRRDEEPEIIDRYKGSAMPEASRKGRTDLALRPS